MENSETDPPPATAGPERRAARGPGDRRRPRRPTAKSLENVALYYLERFASSRENLRRVLERRLRKARAVHPDEDYAALDEAIGDMLDRFERSGLLDDRVYAEHLAESLLRRGESRRRIQQRLRQKGVGADDIGHALARLNDQTAQPDLVAACRLLRRRRLGPYRQRDRAERFEKDLAALARAGFSLDTAREVLGLASPEEVEALERDAAEPAAPQ